MTRKTKRIAVTSIAIVLALIAWRILSTRAKEVPNMNVDVLLTAEGTAGSCTLRFDDRRDKHLSRYDGGWDEGAPNSRRRIQYKLSNDGANECARGLLNIPKFVEKSGGCDPTGAPSGHVTIRNATPGNRVVEVRTTRRRPGSQGSYCYDVQLEVSGRQFRADPEIEIVW